MVARLTPQQQLNEEGAVGSAHVFRGLMFGHSGRWHAINLEEKFKEYECNEK